MNISIEQANKLLSALLDGVAVVADEQEADETVDTDTLLHTLNENLVTTLRPKLEAELKPGFESNFVGRYNGALRAAATRLFGVAKKDIEDLSLDQILAKCKDTFEGNIVQMDAETRTMLETAVQGYEQQLEALKAMYEQQLEAERSKYQQKDIAARCLSIIEKLPRKGGDLQEQAEMLRYKMQSMYEVRYNEEAKKLELYQEGKPVVSDNNQPVNDEDFARMWATKAGILVNDTRYISPAEVKAGQQGAYPSGVIQINEASADGAMEAIAAWTEQ